MKNCPFCGSQNVQAYSFGAKSFVKCEACKAQGPNAQWDRVRSVQLESAEARWNLRFDDTDPYDTLEYQAFVATMAEKCIAADKPCDSCLAGGICDGPDKPYDMNADHEEHGNSWDEDGK